MQVLLKGEDEAGADVQAVVVGTGRLDQLKEMQKEESAVKTKSQRHIGART